MTAPVIMRGQTRSAVDDVAVLGLAVVDDGTSAIDLAARAGRAAMADAGVDTVDVLIHVGVYRDDNIVEPAVAALIQKKIGIGLDYRPGDHHLYSFDLMNGACGVLTAMSVGGALLATGASTVLITAADAHPGGDAADRSPDFPYTPTGAAVLIGRGTGTLGALMTASAEQAAPVGFARIPEVGPAGRRTIVVEPTASTVLQPLVDDVLSRGERTPAVFAAVPADVDITAEQVVRVDGSVHTCGAVLGLLAARDSGLDRITLVAAGGGPEAAAMTYTRPSLDSR
ncbi:hypothetical protein AAFP30_08100 [Gordonia sp. CPCC 205515]|uniref:hypothetical protein n=1 Tax=Gordonia sp. CPCC 205515 TaxID=3140791 RepID=UPI003AF34EAC